MTIPTLEQFETAIDELSRLHAGELRPEIREICDHGESAETIRPMVVDLLRKEDDVRRAKNDSIKMSPVWKWFHSQPAAVNAVHRVFKVPKAKRSSHDVQPSKELTLQKAADWLVEAFDNLNEKEFIEREIGLGHSMAVAEAKLTENNSAIGKRNRFERRLLRSVSRNLYEWDRGTLVALRDYYYSDRWKRVYSEGRNKMRDLESARAGIDAILVLSDHLIDPLVPRPSTLLRHRAQIIDEQLACGIHLTYPIRRSDETSRERMLVFDLYTNNLTNLRGKRVAVIGDLMMLEGIKYPLDMRTVERLIAGWEASYETYRQKTKEFRESCTGTLD